MAVSAESRPGSLRSAASTAGPMDDLSRASRRTYGGLFLITLATLLYELLLTRIFSVTLGYHFAFMVVSMAMFGMTVGAIFVYLLPSAFTIERASRQLALNALLCAICIPLSILTHFSIPIANDPSLVRQYSLMLTYVVAAVPCFFSGIAVCLALTRFPRQVGGLYAVDLAGAALGCLGLVLLLSVADGPSVVFAVALVASLAAILFADGEPLKSIRRNAIIISVVLGLVFLSNSLLAAQQIPFLRVIWVQGQTEPWHPVVYEKWNPFARVRIWGDPNTPSRPISYGMSPAYASDRQYRQLGVNIDASAFTVMTHYSGAASELEHLKYDLTNLAHYLRHNARVLVIGMGGGRDVLTALAFDQQAVVGVEMNHDIVSAVTERFGDFTGHLDRDPRVTVVVDEARSYLASSTDRFDIITVPFIDTWAATASGAYVLTEHSLYTTDAWRIFLEHLTPSGVVTFARWWYGEEPTEIYRLVALASAALTESGVKNPRDHIFLARHIQEGSGDSALGVGTIIVSKEPLTPADLRVLNDTTTRLRFDVVLSPQVARDATFVELTSGKDLQRVVASHPDNISPPTDDSPFFFYTVRLQSILTRSQPGQGPLGGAPAVHTLAVLTFTVVALTLLGIVGPLLLTTRKEILAGCTPLIFFFGAIGIGFMLVEISQLQRLVIFLGHPIYSLSVVLSTLLLASGLGSFSVRRLDVGSTRAALLRFSLLIGVLLIFGLVTPWVVQAFQASSTPIRILVAIGLLSPIGFFMGMAFPIGMTLASLRSPLITPWLWGVNGAASVCGSVLAVLIALNFGLSTSFWTGFACYLAALGAYLWVTRTTPAAAPPALLT